MYTNSRSVKHGLFIVREVIQICPQKDLDRQVGIEDLSEEVWQISDLRSTKSPNLRQQDPKRHLRHEELHQNNKKMPNRRPNLQKGSRGLTIQQEVRGDLDLL